MALNHPAKLRVPRNYEASWAQSCWWFWDKLAVDVFCQLSARHVRLHTANQVPVGKALAPHYAPQAPFEPGSAAAIAGFLLQFQESSD